MAKVPNDVETLPKISIAWVWCRNVSDDRRQTDRRTDGRRHIANVNVSSRSLKSWTDLSSILSQITRLTDGQTDRILIARPRLHSMQRGKNGVLVKCHVHFYG